MGSLPYRRLVEWAPNLCIRVWKDVAMEDPDVVEVWARCGKRGCVRGYVKECIRECIRGLVS